MKTIIADTQLQTIDEMSDRIDSIKRQIEKEENRDFYRIRNFDAHHEKLKKLNCRLDALWIRRANLLKD